MKPFKTLLALVKRLSPRQSSRLYFPSKQAGVAVNYDTALTYSAVWRCVNLISQSVAGMPWTVNSRKVGADGARTTVRNYTHPVAQLLDTAPNDEADAVTFRETLLAHALTWGNGYAEIERDGANRPVALWMIEPERVRIDRDDSGRLVYIVTNGSYGADTYLAPADVYHLKGLGYDGVTGYSVISMAAKAVGVGLATEQFGASFFENGASFSGVFEHPATLGDQAIDHLRDSLTARHGGPANANKPLILEEGMKWSATSIPPNDAQFLETRKFQISEIARWYGVPLHKLNEMDRSTFSNIEHQSIEFVTDCLMPWVRRLETEANIKLISPANRGRIYTKLNVNGLLRGDMATRGDWYQKMANLGAYSVNDIRELEDMNPVEGGEKRLVQLNLTTLEKVGEEPPAPEPTPFEQDDDAGTRVLEDAFGRIVNRERNRMEQWQKAKDFDAAVTKFYKQHADYVAETLQVPFAVNGIDVDPRAFAEDYVTVANIAIWSEGAPLDVARCMLMLEGYSDA